MEMLGVDRNFRCGTGRKLIVRYVIREIDQGDGATSRNACAQILQRPGGLDLAQRDRIQYDANLSLEHPAGDGIEGNFRFVPCPHPLQRILLKAAARVRSPSWTNIITGRSGAGVTYIPGRRAICVTNPSVAARTTV